MRILHGPDNSGYVEFRRAHTRAKVLLHPQEVKSVQRVSDARCVIHVKYADGYNATTDTQLYIDGAADEVLLVLIEAALIAGSPQK